MRSVRHVVEWLNTTGDKYLSSHCARDVSSLSQDGAFKWLEENKNFREEAKEIRDKVKLLLQLADTLLSGSGSGNVHGPAISHWADAVDTKYKESSNRIDHLK